jgi:hypothetical protein
LVAAGALALTGAAQADVLTNPGFETGLSGWVAFGNVFGETANPPAIVPNSGSGVCKMFGGFSGGFNVGGLFQQFPATAGSEWELDVFSRHFSGDPLVGAGPAASNWVVMKIVFRDAADAEIGAAERIILDGTFATDVWHDNTPVTAVAPLNTVSVQAFFLFLQPAFDGGAALLDDARFSQIPSPAAALPLALLGAGLRRRRA